MGLDGEGGGEDFVSRYERWLREQPYGYEQQSQVIADLRRWKAALPDPADQALPEPSSPDPQRGERRFTRQVGLRLSLEDYEAVAEAAEAYGVAPTTLARMLVRRGVRAMLRPPARGPSG